MLTGLTKGKGKKEVPSSTKGKKKGKGKDKESPEQKGPYKPNPESKSPALLKKPKKRKKKVACCLHYALTLPAWRHIPCLWILAIVYF